MFQLEKIKIFRRKHFSVDLGFLPEILRKIYFKFKDKNLLTSNAVTIHGLDNITIIGLLKVGVDSVGFMDHHDRTLLRIQGKLKVQGNFSVGKGCRFDIGKNAMVSLGSGYMGPNTTLVIMHELKIGDGCAISWDCQFLDDDFHAISYHGKPAERPNCISVGHHVWIGSKVTILKGSHIPDGSVIAAGSIVKSQFYEENTLIAGNPAKVVRRNISWK